MTRRAAAALVSLASLAAAAQGPPPAMPREANACVPCHGVRGLSQAPDAPNLAGQPRIYLVAQLRAFRDRSRRHEVMNVMAAGLGDEAIAALAEYYASVAIEVREAK